MHGSINSVTNLLQEMETQQSDLNNDATNVRGSETPQTLPLGSQKTCF